MFYPCIECGRQVTGRQQALLCDGCGAWQHRLCGTGISQEQYRRAVREDTAIEWKCKPCGEKSVLLHIDDGTATKPPVDSSFEQSPPPSPDASIHPLLFPSTTLSRRAPSPPPELNEGFLCDPSILATEDEQDVTTYHLIREGTIHGNMKLVTRDGYSFNIRRRRPNDTIDWQCTVRSKVHRCKASVIQRDGGYIPGIHPHNHPGTVGALAASQIRERVKQSARQELFKPATAIVKEVLLDCMDDAPCPALPELEYLARNTNRFRQRRSARRLLHACPHLYGPRD